MTGNEYQLEQFIGLMNSKLFNWYLKATTTAEVQGGGIQMYATVINKILLKLDFDNDFNEVVNRRINMDVSDNEIDTYVYKLYSLTSSEKEFLIKI